MFLSFMSKFCVAFRDSGTKFQESKNFPKISKMDGPKNTLVHTELWVVHFWKVSEKMSKSQGWLLERVAVSTKFPPYHSFQQPTLGTLIWRSFQKRFTYLLTLCPEAAEIWNCNPKLKNILSVRKLVKSLSPLNTLILIKKMRDKTDLCPAFLSRVWIDRR